MAYTKYSLTPANNNAAPPDGAPEGMLPSAVNDTMRDMMAQIRDCGDGIRGGTYTMTAPVITGGSINGATIGAGTASTGAFTTLSASSTVSGTGFSNYFASPPALGGTAAAAVSSTNLSYTGTLTGGTGVVNLGSGQFYKDASGNVGIGTASPSQRLDVYGGTASSSVAQFTGVNNNRGLTISTFLSTNNDAGVDLNAKDSLYGTLTFSTKSTERIRIDSSGNVGIGNSSPTVKLQVGDATVVATNRLVFGKAQTASEGNLPAIGQQSAGVGNDLALAGTSTSAAIRFYTGASTNSGEIGTGSNAERMRIDPSGNLLVGTTTLQGAGGWTLYPTGSAGGPLAVWNRASTASSGTALNFLNGGSQVGYISYTNTATAYNTSSDYRLKEDIAPMTGALDKVSALKPVTYKWKLDGSAGEGFIAHELAEVVPQAVSGEKDAVDAEGNPKYQGIDTSFLVATLTAAIQELNAKVAALEAA